MLLGLKVPVYDIAIRLPSILKGSPDYNLYVLLCAVRLNHLFPLFLCRRTKALLRSIPPPLLHATLVTLADQSLLLASLPSMREAPGKTLKCVSFCELWTLLSSPIDYSMSLEDLLDRGPLIT
jgi:hypothetical protein